MDNCQLNNADCMVIMAEMQSDSVTLTLTDIPYGVVNRKSQGIRNFDKTTADIETFDIDSFIEQVVRITVGSIYVFCSTEQVSQIRSKLVDLGLTTRLCIWEKSNPSPVNGEYLWLSGVECCVFARKKGAVFNERCKNSVWRFPTERGKIHPTQKPLKLMEYLVGVSSNPGDIVFDPCFGSGTSLLAAKLNNRRSIGIELNSEYFQLAKDRIKNYERN